MALKCLEHTSKVQMYNAWKKLFEATEPPKHVGILDTLAMLLISTLTMPP